MVVAVVVVVVVVVVAVVVVVVVVVVVTLLYILLNCTMNGHHEHMSAGVKEAEAWTHAFSKKIFCKYIV